MVEEARRFRLRLLKSHVQYKLKSLEKYREWFPPTGVVFELRGGERTYRTHVDRANRLKLDDILRQHPGIEPGDYLVFTPVDKGREWEVRVERHRSTVQTALYEPKGVKKRSKPRVLSHSDLIDMLYEMAPHFNMYSEKEFSYEVHRYDVIWRRVKSGNPAKVFEVQVSGNLDSALTKLKHARDLWNSDVFLIVTSTKDAEKAEYLLSGSFHEIASKAAILRGREIYEMLLYNNVLARSRIACEDSHQFAIAQNRRLVHAAITLMLSSWKMESLRKCAHCLL